MTTILFSSEFFNASKISPDFEHECRAAVAAGFEVAFVDAIDVLDFSRHDIKGDVIYRGWIILRSEYLAIQAALIEMGARLTTSFDEYCYASFLPLFYQDLEGHTPRSVWTELSDAASDNWTIVSRDVEIDVKALAERLGATSLIVKDYCKSQKHYWLEACYVPDASDVENLTKVTDRYLELQGGLVGGFVFREYTPLRILSHHSKSGMPLAAEMRTFWKNGELILQHDYWGSEATTNEHPPEGWLKEMASKVRSSFFSMDVAQTVEGSWIVIEIGDGQVTGLPTPESAEAFYQGLKTW